MKLKNKTRIDDKKECWDLEIEDSHCYFVNGTLVHNSNSGVIYNSIDGLWVQSRNRILSLDNDNLSCAYNVEANKSEWLELIDIISKRENIDTTKNNICIFSEWCGSGIQKGVAISKLDKMNIIFGAKVSPFDENKSNYWVSIDGLENHEKRIYNVNNFQTFNFEIDFNNPKEIQNKLIEITTEVGNQCPIGKYFGVEGIGEGVVYTVVDKKGKQHLFKVKDSRHSKSKVKKLAPIDTQKLKDIKEFVDFSCDEGRLLQGISEVFTSNNIEPNIKLTGDYVRWVIKDINAECIDNMIESKLTPKECNKEISKVAKEFLFKYLDQKMGL